MASTTTETTANSHPHGTRLNSRNTTVPTAPPIRNSLNSAIDFTTTSSPAAQLSQALVQSKILKQKQLQLQKQIKEAKSQIKNKLPEAGVQQKPVKQPNLSENDRLVLYHLIEVHKPLGSEQWKVVAIEFNKTQPTKREWKCLKKHYSDMVRRATMKPSGQSQRSAELERVLELEEQLTESYDGGDSVIDAISSNTMDNVEFQFSDDLSDKMENKHRDESNFINLETKEGPAATLSSISSSSAHVPGPENIFNITNTVNSQPAIAANTIVEISRKGTLKRGETTVASGVTNKRARLDTELVKLVQQMTSENNSNSSNTDSSSSEMQKMMFNLQTQSQQMMLTFQQQQQQLTNLIVSLVNNRPLPPTTVI